MVRRVRHDDICKLIDEMFKDESDLSKQKTVERKTKVVESKKRLPISNILFAIAAILLLVMAGSAVVYMETPSEPIDELMAEIESWESVKPLSMDEKFLKWMKDVESEIDDYNKHISKRFANDNYEVIEYWASQLESWVISQEVELLLHLV